MKNQEGGNIRQNVDNRTVSTPIRRSTACRDIFFIIIIIIFNFCILF
jgi:hypothetical protein